MKPAIYLLPLLLTLSHVQAQPVPADSGVTGIYRIEQGVNMTFEVYVDNDQLLLQIIGQGSTTLNRLSPYIYEPQHIRPKVKMVFLKDSTGRVSAFRWTQASAVGVWKRVSGEPRDDAGVFRLENYPYRFLHVSEQGGQLMAHVNSDQDHTLTPLGKDRFLLNWAAAGPHTISFRRNKIGEIAEVRMTGEDVVLIDKQTSVVPRISNRQNGFTRADSLLGALTPLRSCYDVLFYDLDMTILPETKSIRGGNTIRFRTVSDFDRLQVDLHENLAVDKILYHGRELTYTRECNAVFVQLPAMVKAGTIDSFRVEYSGSPLEPNKRLNQGGIFWVWDRNKDPWIASVSQGVGANVFWPCKDHLSDRPDSMRISVTVPTGMEEISNGRLLQRVEVPGGQTRFVWYVDYPIVTYDVAINIGDYIHFTDVYVNGRDSLPLNFYVLRYNSDYAHWFFGDIKRMLALYEKDFGPYPFARDGFNIMESIYPMEHQGAISMGLLNQPFNSRTHDTAGELRTMWHESSHEWWGNSVGCSDFADMWIHEGFASYAEFLNEEATLGRDSALRELKNGQPDNKAPIIGVYNVNHFHMGDMYLKGELMLETLRDLIGNDPLWFGILRGIQRDFRYQPVTSRQIEDYFSRATGTDYSYFFDQYLRHAAIPVLAVHPEPHGADLELRYRWEADVPGFRMPIKVTLAKDSLGFIYPTTSWQTMVLKGLTAADFHVDTMEFYAGVKME